MARRMRVRTAVASIYDSFTITLLMQLEGLGFYEKGKGGSIVAEINHFWNNAVLPECE